MARVFTWFGSFLCLAIGFAFVSSVETGSIHKLSGFLLGLPAGPLKPSADAAATVQKILFALGLHDHITARLVLGMTLIVLGTNGLLLEHPMTTLRFVGQLLLHVVFSTNRLRRERHLAEIAEQSLSTLYSTSGDPLYHKPAPLVAGLLNLLAKGVLALVITALGASIALATHFHYEEARLVSGMVQNRLSICLSRAQLGRMPVQATTQLQEIQSLIGYLAVFRAENKLLRYTLENLAILDDRRNTDEIGDGRFSARVRRALERAIDLQNEAATLTSIMGYPMSEVETFYYSAHQASALYLALNEVNVDSDGDWSLVDEMLGDLRDVHGHHAAHQRLQATIERLGLLRDALYWLQKDRWDADIHVLEQLESVARRFEETAQKQPTYEERVRDQLNAAGVRLSRMELIVRLHERYPDADAATLLARLDTELRSVDPREYGAARVFREFSDALSPAEAAFPDNAVVSMFRADACGVLLRYFRYVVRGRTEPTLRERLSLGDRLLLGRLPEFCRYADQVECPSGGDVTRGGDEFLEDLAVFLRTEQVAALGNMDRLWQGASVWDRIGDSESFVGGAFWDLYQEKDSPAVLRAFELAKMEDPFAR